jgi:hypothetical protein
MPVIVPRAAGRAGWLWLPQAPRLAIRAIPATAAGIRFMSGKTRARPPGFRGALVDRRPGSLLASPADTSFTL